MACPLGADEIAKLKLFVGFCSEKPELLNLPQLSFFKEFIEKLGGHVPPVGSASFTSSSTKSETSEPKVENEPEEVESEPESDVELDNNGVIEPDNDINQPMGDSTKEPTDEERDQASELRSQAAQHYSEQRYADAVADYEKAIELNPTNALFYAKRGQAYLKLNKPNACIRDCNRALELNCDSAAAYKFRGRAHRLLGHWEEAAKDLRQACNIDFDEETDEWLREVTPNAKKLAAHKIKLERKKAEKEENARKERIRRAQEANKRASEQQQHQSAGGDANAGADDAFSQEDILNAFKDPEVAAAFQDIMSNPSNIVKYQSNPKIMSIITKVAGAMGGKIPGFGGAGGAGGFPGFGGAGGAGAAGGFPGGMPGFGGMPGGFPNFTTPPPSEPKPKPSSDLHDDGLD